MVNLLKFLINYCIDLKNQETLMKQEITVGDINSGGYLRVIEFWSMMVRSLIKIIALQQEISERYLMINFPDRENDKIFHRVLEITLI